ncbi:MAG: trypsin-like peptidase domain-containing protein [Promethearchaeota archaeon]
MALRSLEKFISNIRELIILGKIDFALDQLHNYLRSSSPDLRNEVILQLARYNQIRKNIRQNLITEEAAKIEQLRLKNALLEFLDIIPRHITIDKSPSMIITTRPIEVSLPDDTAFERIIGANNLKQISWLQQGLDVSSSICRILTPVGRGTGFLVKPNLIMTNNHVIPSSSVANKSFAEFNYQEDISGRILTSYRYKLKGEILHTNSEDDLDYTIVGLEPNSDSPPIKSWGYLDINSDVFPTIEEHVTIIQHPDGGLKQIALTANQVVNLEYPFVYYTTDTMPGSSGSPVFNDKWKVIALHHKYGGLKRDKKGNDRFVNKGVLMSAIRSDAGNIF